MAEQSIPKVVHDHDGTVTYKDHIFDGPICEACGAVNPDIPIHNRWHKALARALKAGGATFRMEA